jgi:hypothetical protein
MTYTIADIIGIIDKLVQDKCDLREWDDLVSVWHNDKEIDSIVADIIAIEKRFSDRKRGVMISDEGLRVLKQYADGLRGEIRPRH